MSIDWIDFMSDLSMMSHRIHAVLSSFGNTQVLFQNACRPSLRRSRKWHKHQSTIAIFNQYLHESYMIIIEGRLEVKLPTIWTDGRAEVGRVREEKESGDRRSRCAKR